MEESTILYRILQESLTNILRHSHADSVIVSVIEIDEVVSLSVADNGIFKGDKELELGFGLNGMKNVVSRSEAVVPLL